MADRRARRTPKKEAEWQAWLEAFEREGTVSAACDATGLPRRTVYSRRERDPEFAAAWEGVVERSTERLEQEAFRRAVEGVEEPVHYQGERVDTIRKFSDTLLIFLLKGRKPETYRERVEHTGAGGGPVEHRLRLDLSKLSDEQLAALEAIQPDVGSTDAE